MKVIGDKIFYIENFLFSETCQFLISNFSKNIRPSDRPGIFGGPGRGEGNNASAICGIEKIEEQSVEADKNVAIDLFTSLCPNIEKTLSVLFGKDLVLKSYFYSHMKEGGKNDLHVDNYTKEYENDYSAILYLSDSYSGGLLNFPEKKLELKPEPGTLIAFIGTDDLKHEVQKVISGDRINIICFLKEKERLALNEN
jgi:hypothetical protein